MKGRFKLLALAVALPTILLGLGWMAASFRERAALRREQVQRLVRIADAVRGAVDESLEELRRREDRRPFYLYNPLYSPPDVTALNDPIVTSPLAREPADGRIIGYFQVEPGGVVRTPYAMTAEELERSPRGRRVAAIVGAPAFRGLEELTTIPRSDGAPPSPLIGVAQAAMNRADAGVGEEAGEGEVLASRAGVERPVRRAPRPASPAGPVRQAERRDRGDAGASPARADESSALSLGLGLLSGSAESDDADLATPRQPEEPATAINPGGNAVDESLTPQGPLTVSLNSWNQEVYSDIQQAQAGDPVANSRMLARGRAAPITRRNTVDWSAVREERGSGGDGASPSSSSWVNESSGPATPRGEAPSSASATGEPAGARVGSASPQGRARRAAVRQRARRRAAVKRVTPEEGRSEQAERGSPERVEINPDNQYEVEVDYTPMDWLIADRETVALHRVVRHEGTAVVQGVLIDRRYLVDEWIPALIERHAQTDDLPQVVDENSAQVCAVRRPASSLLTNVELCFPPRIMSAASSVVDDGIGLQVAALGGLIVIVVFAGVAIMRSAERAEELSKQKSAFVSSVSHELRTPLTTIRMHAEMLREGLVPEGKREKFHQQLVQESVRLSQLVENVLELSRLEEGRRVLNFSLADLRAAVKGIVDERRDSVRERGFELEGPPPGEPLRLSFDAPAITQIVVNLIENAVKYGSGEENLITVELQREGEGAMLIVRDRGEGIPEAERRRVFERFHRVQSVERQHMPGTGIGLALVRELARAHGGDVEAAEAEGGGCEIRVFLPRAEDEG